MWQSILLAEVFRIQFMREKFHPPFNSFHNPTVVAKQIGPVRGSGWGVLEQIYGQEKRIVM